MLLFYNILNSIATNLDISIIYHSKVGIKYLNSPFSERLLDNYILDTTEFKIPVDKLLLGTDNLKDEYTLIGKQIINTPYTDLMDKLNSGKNINKCCYIKMYRKGTLDKRRPQNISRKFIQRIKTAFSIQKAKIENNTYNPVKCIILNNKYYIADGRHTVALCSLLNIIPKCVAGTMVYHDSWFLWIYDKMKKTNHFQKHINYYRDVLKI